MLVKINPSLGANTDPRNRMFNVMRAIRDVATANAGTTPTCNVISGPTGTLEANQMITVIANDEAGGWTMDTANGNIGNTYNSSFSNVYVLHLYNDTGKSTWPYKTFTYRLNPSHTFSSGQYVNYPSAVVYYGVSNNTVYGTTPSAYAVGSGTYNELMNDYNNQYTSVTNTNLVPLRDSTSATICPGHYNQGEFFMASTSDYIILFQPNNYILYCGTRTTQAWEDAFADNPPVCGFFYTRLNLPHSVMMWTRLLNTSNTTSSNAELVTHKITGATQSSPSTWTNNTSHPYHVVTGMMRSSSPTAGVNNRYAARMNSSAQGSSGVNANTANSWIAPLFYSAAHVNEAMRLSWTTDFSTGGRWYQAPCYLPVYDSSTQTFQPPAIPITFAYYSNRYTPGGRIKGMFKSLSGSQNFLSQYGTHEQDFNVTINGNTEPYELLWSAPQQYGIANSTYADIAYTDTFLIRKK